LVHVKADSEWDSIHYLWDFSKGKKPSMLVALTKLNTTVDINWTKYLNNEEHAISFQPAADYVFVVVLNRIWEFNDVDDQAWLSHTSKLNASDLYSFQTQDVAWARENVKSSEELMMLAMTGTNKVIFGDSGDFQVTVGFCLY
jgi:Lysosomal transcription factor, NCU-G1